MLNRCYQTLPGWEEIGKDTICIHPGLYISVILADLFRTANMECSLCTHYRPKSPPAQHPPTPSFSLWQAGKHWQCHPRGDLCWSSRGVEEIKAKYTQKSVAKTRWHQKVVPVRNSTTCLQWTQLGGHVRGRRGKHFQFGCAPRILSHDTCSLPKILLLQRLKKGKVNNFRHFLTLFKLTAEFGSSSCDWEVEAPLLLM